MFNIIGAGNMGLAVAGALFELGKKVRIIDIDEDKLQRLQSGIWRPEGRDFWTKIPVSTKVPEDGWNLICVQTPVTNSVCDYTSLKSTLGHPKTVIMSTIFPDAPFLEYDILHPVFLREGTGIDDYKNPGKVILGGEASLCREFWEQTGILCTPTIVDVETAKWAKVIHNSFMCMKICFSNAWGDVIGNKSWDALSAALTENSNGRLLSLSHMRPGKPFDGPCLPKDASVMKQYGGFLKSAWDYNRSKIEDVFNFLNDAKKPGLAGLAFRPGSDEIRDSIGLELMERIPKLVAWDPDLDVDRWDIISRGSHSVLALKNRIVSSLESCDRVLINRKGVNVNCETINFYGE